MVYSIPATLKVRPGAMWFDDYRKSMKRSRGGRTQTWFQQLKEGHNGRLGFSDFLKSFVDRQSLYLEQGEETNSESAQIQHTNGTTTATTTSTSSPQSKPDNTLSSTSAGVSTTTTTTATIRRKRKSFPNRSPAKTVDETRLPETGLRKTKIIKI